MDNLTRLEADANANCRSINSSVYVVVPDHRMESAVGATRQIKRDNALIANLSDNRIVRADRSKIINKFVSDGGDTKRRENGEGADNGDF